MRAIIIALCMLASPALADMEARHEGGDVLRITQSPCPPAVLSVIPQGHRGVFRLALDTLGGVTFRACWALRTDGLVLVVYDDGDQGMVPMALFRQVGDL